MILPGISGSFVLILMGNYQLVMINAVNQMNVSILAPVVLGAIFGLIAFSNFLSWVFKKFPDYTIASLTGFILGSLGIIWPWKNNVYQIDVNGAFALNRKGEKIVTGYEWFLPDSFTTEVVIALGFIVLGFLTIWIIEYLAGKRVNK